MNRKSFALSAAFILLSFSRMVADGFIVVRDPGPVPPGHYPFAPLEVSKHHVEVKITGQIATTSVDEEFYNPNDRQLEGTYLFPVPKDAHIDKFSMEVNGKMTDAELLPADKARKIYEDIVRQMRDPALLEYAGRDVFKARIFPIESRSRKEVKIVYSELLKSDNGSLSYSYPLNTEKFSAQPIKSLSIKVDVTSDQALAAIYSPSHLVEVKRDGAKHAIIGYEAKNEKPDTDFQLVMTPEKGDVSLHLMSYRDADSDGDGYFLLLAAPSVDTQDAKPAPKDVIFVLDTSGSMAGEKIKQAKKALEFCVQSLNEEDRFEIVRFSTDTDTLFDKLTPVTDASRKRATKFIDGLKAEGGTAIAEALKVALKSKPEKEDRPFVVIFLTDGLPTVGPSREEDILAVTHSNGGGNTRIFSFGVGSDVNTQLLDRIAESTRAFSQYVLPQEDIEVKVSNFFAKIKDPMMTNLKLEFAGDVRTSKMYPSELPDVFKGDQLVLAGRYNGSGEVTAKLTGKVAGKDQAFEFKVKFAEKNTDHEYIPRLWATRRIGFLLDEIRIHGQNKEIIDEATSLARQYGIVTPYTAYLIVEDEKKRNVPVAQRTMGEMSKDTDAMEGAGQGYRNFTEQKTGDAGVANAQSQNSMKYADQAETATKASADLAARAITISGNSATTTGMGGNGQASYTAATVAKISQYTQQSKYVNGRAFFQNSKQWIDSKTQGLTKHQNVKFNSDAYYDLLAKHPEAAQWLALGSNMQVAIDDTIYEITE